MSVEKSRKKVIIIVGPTGVGKTDLSIRLAQRLDGEIISADSRLFYRGMDIGTAKPTCEELGSIPHHMIDITDPDQNIPLPEYQKMILKTIEEIHSRKRVPIIVGGTGQYIRSLTQGWIVPPLEPNNRMRAVLEKWAEEIGSQTLHDKLSLIDWEGSQLIEPNNVRRTIRALEVVFSTGLKFSSLREKRFPLFDFWTIGLMRDRVQLFKRVDERIEKMFESGFVREVQELLGKGYDPDIPNLSAIGYREVIQFLQGVMTLEKAKEIMRQKTHQFVRRQANWFKPTDSSIHWYSMEPYPLSAILTDLTLFLGDDGVAR